MSKDKEKSPESSATSFLQMLTLEVGDDKFRNELFEFLKGLYLRLLYGFKLAMFTVSCSKSALFLISDKSLLDS